MKDVGGSERGSATVLVLALAAVLSAALLVMLGAVAVVAARHRAAAAADLAALAGAGARWTGGSEACAVAAGIAERNGARLAACRVEGPDVVVRAEVSASPVLWFPVPSSTVRVWARAGPAR